MNLSRLLPCLILAAILGACASTPPPTFFTLESAQPNVARSSDKPAIAVVRVYLPELIDRPQLVIRSSSHQVVLNEQYRWAEPLRRQIPRILARDLGDILDSNRVAALAVDANDFDPDFKIMVDIQRMDAIAGQGVAIDALWRIEPRHGKAFVGRSDLSEPMEGATTGLPEYSVLVAAQRRALRHLASDIAGKLTTRFGNEK